MKNGLLITQDEDVINSILGSQVSDLFKFSLKNDLFIALKLLAKKKYNVVIYDFDSSKIDAKEAISTIKKLENQIHLIVIAGEDFNKQSRKLDRKKIDFLLFKPLDESEILNHLSLYIDVLDRGNQFV
jgi:two-component system, NarL family, sensor histidine kinase BarA